MMSYRVQEVIVHPKAEDSFFGLGEDDFVLDTDWRNANRLVLAVATPVEIEYQCGALTSDNEPCQITVDGPDETCQHH